MLVMFVDIIFNFFGKSPDSYFQVLEIKNLEILLKEIIKDICVKEV